uniref:DUF4005 domain-containing protein n=1 Tax=Leersia perrieri TaxID=77586 RepID=A0A0D9WHF2_9ORYZ
MGRKGRWLDAVQRVLSTSENGREENEGKAKKSTEKSSLKKILQFTKSKPSTSSVPETAPASQQPRHHHHHHPPPAQPDRQQDEEIKEAKSTSEQSSHVAAADENAVAAAARTPARSVEELAAVKIQAACRIYLARRAHLARGLDRLMSLLEGIPVKRQTDEALYCMQTMTRVQTQIHSRRVKTEEDKKALKIEVHVKQGADKTKIGEGWDHGHQSKEQIEAVLTMKQEAASRRQRALAYAFSHQWSNRKPSSARAAPPPMFMDTGNPNWGWSWAERWMAAARPWESQTTPDNIARAAPAKVAGGGGRRVSISVQIPTTPAAGGRMFTRPPSCPSPSSTPTPRSRWRAPPTSPGASPLHGRAAASGGLRRTTSLQAERPRSSQERRAAAAGSGSPIHGGEKGAAGGGVVSLRRTTSLRSGELPRRLSLGGGAPARDDAAAPASTAPPLTPSYMQTTKSVRAKAWPAPVELPGERAPDLPSPSVINRRLSLALADKAGGVSSPSSKAKGERSTPRRSQPPSPRF